MASEQPRSPQPPPPPPPPSGIFLPNLHGSAEHRERAKGEIIIQHIQDADMTQLEAEVKGADRKHLNFQDANGYTALHWAAHCDEPKMLAFLITSHCDIKLLTKRGETFLHRAAARNAMRVFSAIEVSNTSQTPANADIRNPRIRITKAVLDAKNVWGETAIHIAAAGGHVNVVQSLAQCRADINAVDNWGRTPLEVANETQEKASQCYLSKIGGKVSDNSCPRDKMEEHLKANNVKDKQKSIMSEFVKKVKKLRDQPKDAPERVPTSGETKGATLKERKMYKKPAKPALSKQMEYPGNIESLKEALDSSIYDPAGKDMYGLTALHKAASWNKTDLVELLLPHLTKNDINLQTPKDKNTALHLAVSMGANRTTEYLLQNSTINTGLKDSKGRTARALYEEMGCATPWEQLASPSL